VAEERKQLERKLKENDERVSAMKGCDPPPDLADQERGRAELQKQLDEAHAEAATAASGKPRAKPPTPAPCSTPGDPLCEEPSPRPAGSPH